MGFLPAYSDSFLFSSQFDSLAGATNTETCNLPVVRNNQTNDALLCHFTRGKLMTVLKANATEIRDAIIRYVSERGSMSPSEIYVPATQNFPQNSYYEIKRIVKEMEKDKTLVPDIIFGGLTLSS